MDRRLTVSGRMAEATSMKRSEASPGSILMERRSRTSARLLLYTVTATSVWSSTVV